LIDIYKALGGGWQIRYGNRSAPMQTVVMEGSLDQPVAPTPEADTLPPVPADDEL
jgi:hypothetical protein